MSKNKKIILSIILIIFIVFGMLNLFWLKYYFKVKQYTEKVEKTDLGGEIYYTLSQDGYKFNVILPDYLDFSTNLAISEPSIIVDDTNITPGNLLIIWIYPFKKDTFGIMISHKNSNNEYETYYYNIDNKGNIIPTDEDDNSIEVFNQHQEEIYNMINAYHVVWG